MATKKRGLMIGAGGMAGAWIRQFLPNFSDRLEIVGLVDIHRPTLDASGDFLGLKPDQRFVDASTTFSSVDADFCIVVIPPAFHTEMVTRATARRMPILSEKPISDTWESCLAAYRAVRAADVKMQVIQNYRDNAPMVTFRDVLRSANLGRINYVVGRFAADYREPLSWGAAFRHEIPHALLVERRILRAVHHDDDEWRARELRRIGGGGLITEEVVPARPAWEGHNHLIGEFLDWLDSGPTPATVIDDNIKTAAMLFGAIEASRTKQTVDVEAMLAQGIS